MPAIEQPYYGAKSVGAGLSDLWSFYKMSGLIHHAVHLVFFSVRLVFFLGYQAHNFIMV